MSPLVSFLTFVLLFTFLSRVESSNYLKSNEIWYDSISCDLSEVIFESSDPTVISTHRDGGLPLIDSCFYGEYAGYDNSYIIIPFESEIADFTLNIQSRFFSFCDLGGIHYIDVMSGSKTVRVYDKTRPKAGRIRSCDTFTSEIIMNTDGWLYDLTCAERTDKNWISCYDDVDVDASIKGNLFSIKYGVDSYDQINNAAWAVANIQLQIVDRSVSPTRQPSQSPTPQPTSNSLPPTTSQPTASPLDGPRSIRYGTVYYDSQICDSHGWKFETKSPPAVALRHIDAPNVGITSCFYGAWDGWENDNVTGVVWFVSDVTNFILNIQLRIWSICDVEENHFIEIWDTSRPAGVFERIYDKSRIKVHIKYMCTGWTGVFTPPLDSWYYDLPCAQRVESGEEDWDTCYDDVNLSIPIIGNEFKIKIGSGINGPDTNELHAFSNIRLEITDFYISNEPTVSSVDPTRNPTMSPIILPTENPTQNSMSPTKYPTKSNTFSNGCCSGTRDKCLRKHDMVSCLNKKCDWNSNSDMCKFDCCRKIDRKSKTKPNCKSLDLDTCVNLRSDCDLTYCDSQGI